MTIAMPHTPELSAARQRLQDAVRPIDGWPPPEFSQLVNGELAAVDPDAPGWISYVTKEIPGVLMDMQAVERRIIHEPGLQPARRIHRLQLQTARQELLRAAVPDAVRVRALMGLRAIAESLDSGDAQADQIFAAAKSGWDIGLLDEIVLKGVRSDAVTSVIVAPKEGEWLLYEQFTSSPHEQISRDPTKVDEALAMHHEFANLARRVEGNEEAEEGMTSIARGPRARRAKLCPPCP